MSTLYSNDFLEPITSEVKRKKFCTVDIESKHDDTQDKGFTRPFLIGTYDPLRRNYRDFSNDVAVAGKPWEERAAAGGGCVDQVMNYLLSHHFKDYVIYAHFGGSFDHLFWLSWLKKHNDEYGFEIMPVQSSIQAIKVWRRPEDPEAPITERWEFLDSFKLFPMGLDKLCQTFGLAGKVEQDLDVHEDDPSWKVYLKQDCIALADGLTKIHDLIEQRLGGEVGMTTPSTSMKLFRRKYLGKGGTPKRLPRYTHWPDCKNKEECTGCAEEWIRKGYFGGRTEMFETFGERLHYYDINSSYVAAMREEMPVGNRMVTTTLDWRMADKHVGFVECSVDIPEGCVLPPLPFRAQTGKLIFPTGKFTGIWSTNELKLLSDSLVKGTITAVKKVVWFGLRPVFNEMVDELWKLRDKTLPGYDEGLSALGKLLGNSLYGKFGMRRERTSIVVKRDVDNQHCFLCQEPVEDEKKGGLCKACQGSKPASNATSTVWYQAKETDADYIMPHISSHITALARVRLWGFMKDAIVAGGRVLYCDSVTEDRTTIVQTPSGEICVMTMGDLWSRTRLRESAGPKEMAALNGWNAWTRDSSGRDGWFPITNIIRHRAGKDTWRISTKHGQTQVTTDHGIMVNGQETTPSEFVSQNANFTKVSAPLAADAATTIDIAHYLGDAKREFTITSEHILVHLKTRSGKKSPMEGVKIRRFYSGDELSALLRLIGSYVCDGSASFKPRAMLSFCKANLRTMERIKRDLLVVAPEHETFGPFWSDTARVVRSGTVAMSVFFDALCGRGSKAKKFPPFVYRLSLGHLDQLLLAIKEGDTTVDDAGRLRFTTTSGRLAAGVSLLFAQRGFPHGFTFRESKGAWTIRTRKGKERTSRYSIKSEVFKSVPGEFVYDLSVEGAHTFVDGIGQILLHNTDSIITDAVIPSTTALGAMKDEYPLPFAKSAAECFAFNTLDNLETWLEGHLLRGTFVQAKVYMIETGALDGKGEPTKAKVTMKGFPRHLRTKENLARLQEGAVLEYQNLEKVRTLAALGLTRGPRMKTVKKSFRGTYDKRVLNEDGLTTRAVVLDEPNFVEEVDARNPTQEEGSEPLAGKGLASEGLGSDVVGKILDGLLSNVDRLMGCVRGARDEAGLAF